MTLQTNSSCFQNNEDTNFLPQPCPSHIPATSSLCLQREWEAASQKVTKRKPVAGICCKNAFREGEILVLKNSWQSITYCFFLVLIFPLFCMHLYHLFPFFFSLLFSLQLRDFLFHFPQPTSSSAPGLPGATSSATPARNARPQARWPLSSQLTLPLPDREEGHCCLPTHRLQTPSPSWMLPASKLIRAGGMLLCRSRRDATGWVVQLHLLLSLHLPPFFRLLPWLWCRQQLLSASKVYHSTGLWEQGELQQQVTQKRHKTPTRELPCTDLSFAHTQQ